MSKPTETKTPQGSGESDPRVPAEQTATRLKAANEQLVLAALRARELAESADEFRLLVDSVKEYAIITLDRAGCVRTWNSGAVRMLGYDADDIVGRHFSTFYAPEDVASGACDHDIALASREGHGEVEGVRVRRDGSHFLASFVMTALRNAADELVGFGVVTRDLTDRVRMDEARIELARVAQAERMKDEFLAIMGHELRNPLAPMVTAVHLLKSRGDAKIDRELAVLDRQLHHMMRLVDDLLDVSRSRQGKLSLSTGPTEISTVLTNVIEMVMPLLEGAHHHLELDVAATGLAVDVDPARAAQIFANLLTNSAKYTPPRGHIRVVARAEREQIVVAVEDDGVGIAPDLMPRLFELFSQGAQEIHREHGGLGVGLALAHRLVKAHGGEIVAHSDGPGRGSRFIVRLPRAATAPSPRVVPEAASLLPAATPRNVLIVDDNRDSAEMLEVLLQQLGHATRVALDGLDALRLAAEEPPDVVILDIGLPGLDGFEVARRLRELPSCTGIPIVAVSGYASDADRKKALQAGFTEHFAKPVDFGRLRDAVEHSASKT